jgi:hypothetical protein
MDSIDYWGNDLPKCPHCGTDFQVWKDDNPLNLSYEDDGQSVFDCDSCRKEFVVVTQVQYRFHTAVSEEAADEQQWGPQKLELSHYDGDRAK